MRPIERAHEVKGRMILGLISYEEAKEELQPILKEMEEQAKEIAKKYGKRPPKFSAISFLR